MKQEQWRLESTIRSTLRVGGSESERISTDTAARSIHSSIHPSVRPSVSAPSQPPLSPAALLFKRRGIRRSFTVSLEGRRATSY